MILGIGGALLAASTMSLTVNAPWLQGRWNAAQASQTLADQLEALPGVTHVDAAYLPMALPDDKLRIAVTFAHDAPVGTWAAADRRIRDALISSPLAAVTGTATFSVAGAGATSGGRVTVAPLAVTPDQLAAELTRWRALRAQLDPSLSVDLAPRDSANTGYTRAYTIDSETAMRRIAANWTAETSSPDGSAAASTTWFGPGFSTQGTPTPAALAAFTLVARHVPLMPATTQRTMPSLSAAVLDGTQGVHVQFLSTTTTLTLTPDLAASLIALTQAGIAPLVVDVVGTHVDPGAFSGPCAGTIQTSDADRDFLDRLRAAGASMTGFTAGRCIVTSAHG